MVLSLGKSYAAATGLKHLHLLEFFLSLLSGSVGDLEGRRRREGECFLL